MKTSIFILAFILSWPLFSHPLDDLSGAEITQATQILRKEVSEETKFPLLCLAEPAKADVLSGKVGTRRARVGVFEAKKNHYREAIVDLKQNKVVQWKEFPGVHPPILLDEYDQMSAIVKNNSEWQAAIKKRGLEIKDVFVDSWVSGLLTDKEKATKARLMRGLTYFKGDKKNFYSRPVEGLVVTVDMNKGKVLEVRDTGAVPLASGVRELDPASNAPLRAALKPLIVKQPDGPSFKVNGQEIEWQNWKVRYSIHPQRGLTLYQVTYNDKGKTRSVMYKGGLVDMVVPYADPDQNWIFRNAFDVGEYGIGRTAHTLEPGEDAPANAVFFDATFATDSGEPFTIAKAVSLYEREMGVQWKHFDQYSRKVEVRRDRELVLGFMTTVGNYDYGINYVFHLDGMIEVEAQLTGILLAKGTPLTVNPCEGGCIPLVEKNILAPNHQHFFNFRLDMDIDGNTNNAAIEVNMKRPFRNPHHNAFIVDNSYLTKEKDAGRELNLASARKWKVVSTEAKNALGHPTGYALMTGENSVPFLTKNSQIWKRADFIHHPVWFTRYHDEEQSGAGEYPNQDTGGHGLELWQKNNENLKGEDVVLWYTFGITHSPRPEDWPVMPVHKANFKLMPFNFFSENPTLDLPPREK